MAVTHLDEAIVESDEFGGLFLSTQILDSSLPSSIANKISKATRIPVESIFFVLPYQTRSIEADPIKDYLALDLFTTLAEISCDWLENRRRGPDVLSKTLNAPLVNIINFISLGRD